MKNPIVWIEIPVSDMTRAIDFYYAAFGWQLNLMIMGPLKMAMMPNNDSADGASGALVYHEQAYAVAKSNEGPVVYFRTDGINKQLESISNAGGVVIQPKTLISPDYGSMALFYDSEGNRLALFSTEKD